MFIKSKRITYFLLFSNSAPRRGQLTLKWLMVARLFLLLVVRRPWGNLTPSISNREGGYRFDAPPSPKRLFQWEKGN